MKIIKSNISGLYEIRKIKKKDTRGFFLRNYCKKILKKNEIDFNIVQTNISFNKNKFSLRGFHAQKKPYTENKIITVLNGKIFNISIDLRTKSKTFLKRKSLIISADKLNSLIIPAGCANAFLTLENDTVIHYYMSDFFEEIAPRKYFGFRYDDQFFKIKWPFKPKFISQKDLSYKNFEIEKL
jgi:dTDP-4-dehydrorhamnose 3,5-epimerase